MKFENQYLTYDEYRLMGGKMEYMPFNLLEFEARKIIDNETFGRLKNLKEQVQEVKMCIYNIINAIESYFSITNIDNSKGINKGNIASENTDGYSVSYVTTDQVLANKSNIIKSKQAELKDIVDDYLGECKLENGIPYLYRG